MLPAWHLARQIVLKFHWAKDLRCEKQPSAQLWIGRTVVLQIGAQPSLPIKVSFRWSHETKGVGTVQTYRKEGELALLIRVASTLGLPRPAWNLTASQPRLWPAQESEPPRRHPRRRRKPEAHSSQVPNRNKRS